MRVHQPVDLTAHVVVALECVDIREAGKTVDADTSGALLTNGNVANRTESVKRVGSAEMALPKRKQPRLLECAWQSM